MQNENHASHGGRGYGLSVKHRGHRDDVGDRGSEVTLDAGLFHDAIGRMAGFDVG